MLYNGVQCEFPPGYDGTVLLERLQPILDPELDESILQLGFIQSPPRPRWACHHCRPTANKLVCSELCLYDG